MVARLRECTENEEVQAQRVVTLLKIPAIAISASANPFSMKFALGANISAATLSDRLFSFRVIDSVQWTTRRGIGRRPGFTKKNATPAHSFLSRMVARSLNRHTSTRLEFEARLTSNEHESHQRRSNWLNNRSFVS